MITTAIPARQTRHNRGGLFDYISPTRLNTWLSCPLKFKLRYVDGVKEPTSPSLFVGKRVHEGLEYFYRHRQNRETVSESEVCQHMTRTWDEAVSADEMTFTSFEDEEALMRQSVQLVQTYLAERVPDEAVPIAVETPLECPLVDPVTGESLGIALLGFVDLVLDGSSGPIIIDFKTSSRSSAPLEIAHELQLTCYAYAFRHVFNQTEGELQIRSLIKTKTPKVETHRYPARGDRHFRRLFAVIREYLDSLRTRRFVFRPAWTCSLCDFRETYCQTWQG